MNSHVGYQAEEYCTTMLWKQKPDGTKTEEDEKYYLLDPSLPKDKQIREELQKKTIEDVLARHQFERMDKNYIRGCLYCRNSLETTRYSYVEHLFSKHFLQLGKPENLVFIDELIDLIEEKLTNLICLYCEKVFKDRPTLKEHMRKKGHKRINPEIKTYDRYFMCNYKMNTQEKVPERKFYNPKAVQRTLQPQRNQNEEQTVFDSDENDDWSDWNDHDQDVDIICLFCQHKESNFETLIVHMGDAHSFDFDDATKNLSFYQKVKLVNYIRRKVHLKQCLSCDVHCESSAELVTHMHESNHILCSQIDFEKAEFFFPTFEDDSFLCHLDKFNDEDDENMSDDSGAVVISEDRIAIMNEAAESLSREKFIEM